MQSFVLEFLGVDLLTLSVYKLGTLPNLQLAFPNTYFVKGLMMIM